MHIHCQQKEYMCERVGKGKYSFTKFQHINVNHAETAKEIQELSLFLLPYVISAAACTAPVQKGGKAISPHIKGYVVHRTVLLQNIRGKKRRHAVGMGYLYQSNRWWSKGHNKRSVTL